MIKDAKGRKWFMRFRQYQQGWHWEARHENMGQSCGFEFFASKALAEADARRSITSYDAIASSREFFKRTAKRGVTPCQLTADDHETIARAGRNSRD